MPDPDSVPPATAICVNAVMPFSPSCRSPSRHYCTTRPPCDACHVYGAHLAAAAAAASPKRSIPSAPCTSPISALLAFSFLPSFCFSLPSLSGAVRDVIVTGREGKGLVQVRDRRSGVSYLFIPLENTKERLTSSLITRLIQQIRT
jgi:hypothetical protein